MGVIAVVGGVVVEAKPNKIFRRDTEMVFATHKKGVSHSLMVWS